MKTIEINKTSMLFRLASVYGNLSSRHWDEPVCDYYGTILPLSICKFNKHVLLGIGAVIMLIIFFAIISCIALTPMFYLTLYFIHGMFFQTTWLEITLFIYAIVVFVCAIYLLAVLLSKLSTMYTNRPKTKIIRNGYITEAFRSIKDKICIPVTFK